MKIHQNFIGGNIRVKDRIENTFLLENELRDTAGDWFYWAFCVEDAQAGEFIFRFDKKRVGYWGAAVSTDLNTWTWVENRDGDSFRYAFREGEKLYFAHHPLYHPARFFSLAERQGLEVSTLCQSRKGRSVPCVHLGNGSQSIVLTARHHACESTGSYVLEGVLTSLCEHPIEDTRVLCVPFVDYDGVLDGDQGKSRVPHDHNRDYACDAPHVYPEVEAICNYVDLYGCNYGFDFHSPWHCSGENDRIFIVQNSVEKLDKLDRFSKLLEQEITDKSMKYSSGNDHPPMTGWNMPSPNFGCTMMQRPECDIAFSLESAYFGTADNKVDAQKLVGLGKCFANALRRYMGE